MALKRYSEFALLAILLASLVAAVPASASDCWMVRNFRGYSAYSAEDYRFIEDRFSQPILVCFTAEGGSVTGLDVPVMKFGDSTLAGYGGNDKGNEMFVVYQLDRERKKMLYIQTRVGTKTVAPILSDVVRSFVGDAVHVDE